MVLLANKCDLDLPIDRSVRCAWHKDGSVRHANDHLTTLSSSMYPVAQDLGGVGTVTLPFVLATVVASIRHHFARRLCFMFRIPELS